MTTVRSGAVRNARSVSFLSLSLRRALPRSRPEGWLIAYSTFHSHSYAVLLLHCAELHRN
jgi:hypothetical protein